ncbi:hypothetical protein FVE85_5471 [Porphyridium purpureum]|uniref:Uncharacterized protein n=1 Tax=Porphyridium purpureum TaxID=35688 RepID=A0A5J4Z2M9_PORPP|nr:hypothetical protein FVE85_5471 [Porphyridium purpureum]|eukprot:POR7058..scf295_1
MSKKNKLSTRKRANEFTVRTEKTRATEMKLRQTKRAHNKQLLSELVQMTTSVKVNEHRDGPLLPPLGSSPMSEKPARGNGKVRKPRKQDVRRKNKIAQRMQNQKAMIK